jgi:hypothetical protein
LTTSSPLARRLGNQPGRQQVLPSRLQAGKVSINSIVRVSGAARMRFVVPLLASDGATALIIEGPLQGSATVAYLGEYRVSYYPKLTARLDAEG